MGIFNHYARPGLNFYSVRMAVFFSGYCHTMNSESHSNIFIKKAKILLCVLKNFTFVLLHREYNNLLFMEFFVVNEVVKQYGNQVVLDKVNVTISEGSIYGLLGPNGAGKTTLIRIINQITAPDSGTLFFRGKKLCREDISRIGYLPEERGLYKKMKVGEQSLYLARLKGMSRRDAMTALKFWFEKFEIQPWWNKKVEELSKGMQQKLQFITTVIHKPELLIFDEPFSGFDPINTDLLKSEILNLRKEGATVIFSTHNMASVEELCDDISLVNRSKIILQGSVRQIRQNYRNGNYEITYSGIPSEFEELLRQNGCALQKSENQGNENFASLVIPSGFSGNDLLKLLLSRVEIHSFREVMPGMNDIFIQTVRQSGSFNSQNDLL
jgi:ABC-2 type transport system ATP-binding protein